MSAAETNRTRLAVGAGISFAIALFLALTLLLCSKFSGAEFTAFVLAFAVLSVAVGFAPEVQEISIVGNVVKLKEVKAEALKAIESLNKSRIEMLRIFLRLALKHGGGFASEAPVDPRSLDLWPLFSLAKDYDCQKELKAELLLSVKSLLVGQLRNIVIRNKDSRILISEPFLAPFELALIAFEVNGIEAAENARSPKPENYREEIKLALEEYSKLYEYMMQLEAIE